MSSSLSVVSAARTLVRRFNRRSRRVVRRIPAMSMPVVCTDILLLRTLATVVLIVGAVAGWQLSRRRVNASPQHEPGYARVLLRLMSRADHASENYITSIQGHLAVLGQELPTDQERWQISRGAIADAATQMKRHTERLRLIRLGLDETNLRVAPVNLANLIEHILITLEPAATQRDVTLRMEVHRLNTAVPGDPQMFEEIFTTLLENAIKHNPPGTEVVAELSTRDGMVLTRVSDTGKGVNEELMAHLFEEGACDRQAGAPRGTGMGLYIARMLTELHAGTVTVHSQPGKGSVFSVALPLATGKRNAGNHGANGDRLQEPGAAYERMTSQAAIHRTSEARSGTTQ